MAKHSNPQGRFSIDYERHAIYQGMDSELQKTVGQEIHWLVYDAKESEKDPIYDVASIGTGRRWQRAVRVPVLAAIIYQGDSSQNNRGFYNTDILRVTVAADKLLTPLPDVTTQPDRHIRDRIAYRGALFVPHMMAPRGLLHDQYTVITIDCYQVNPEESVNDEQLTQNQVPYSVITAADDPYMSDFAWTPEDEPASLPPVTFDTP